LSVHSSNLNSCDFFLSGAVWRTKLTSNCQREEEQKENIHKGIENISAEQKSKSEHLFQCEECLCVEGQHLQHNLWSAKCNHFIIYVTSHQLYWFRQQNLYSPHSRHTGCCKAQRCEQVNTCKNFPVCGINMVTLLLHAYSNNEVYKVYSLCHIFSFGSLPSNMWTQFDCVCFNTLIHK
jgi:hypothetical protein